jgi:hypothetical protein
VLQPSVSRFRLAGFSIEVKLGAPGAHQPTYVGRAEWGKPPIPLYIAHRTTREGDPRRGVLGKITAKNGLLKRWCHRAPSRAELHVQLYVTLAL